MPTARSRSSILDLSVGSAEFGRSCASTGANTGEGRYTYNGDGLRIRERTYPTGAPFVTRDFTWDQGSRLPNILQETWTPNGGASATVSYVYGLGQIAATDSAGGTSYFLADGLGSTTQLASTTGAVTDSYTYDVFGAPRSQTGTTANDFRFTGQQQDSGANRGLVYLRARHYDPALGRFLGRDPVAGKNRYAYVGNNPVNLTDPYGLFPCPGCGNIKKAAGAVGGGIGSGADCIVDVKCSQKVATRLDEFSAYASNVRAGITNAATVVGCAGGYVVAGGDGLAVGCLLRKGVGEVATLPLNNASNVASVISSAIGCSGRLFGDSKEGGGFNLTNITSCGESALLTSVGFLPEANINALAADYQYYCLDLGKC